MLSENCSPFKFVCVSMNVLNIPVFLLAATVDVHVPISWYGEKAILNCWNQSHPATAVHSQRNGTIRWFIMNQTGQWIRLLPRPYLSDAISSKRRCFLIEHRPHLCHYSQGLTLEVMYTAQLLGVIYACQGAWENGANFYYNFHLDYGGDDVSHVPETGKNQQSRIVARFYGILIAFLYNVVWSVKIYPKSPFQISSIVSLVTHRCVTNPSSSLTASPGEDHKNTVRPRWVNTLRPRQNCCHFANDIFKCIFLSENVWISFKISLKYVPNVWINNIPAMVQKMAPSRRQAIIWTNIAMMVSLLIHICITRSQWVSHQGWATHICISKPGHCWII